MMYIDNLNNFANSDRFDIKSQDGTSGNKSEFQNLLHGSGQEKLPGREGLRVSLQWQNGKMAKSNEIPILKTDIDNVINDEKVPKQWKNSEILSISPKDNWDVKKLEEGSSENNRNVDLLNILDIRNNENSKNSNFNNNLGILKLDNFENTSVKNIIGQITDYLIQNGINKIDFLEVVVDHEDLGRFKIDVQKSGKNGQVDLKIEVMTAEGKDFFQKHEALLSKSLANGGVNIQDFKIIESKENILLNSFFSKSDNIISNLEKDIPNDENNGNRDKHEQNEKDERYYQSKEKYMNEEEEDAQYW